MQDHLKDIVTDGGIDLDMMDNDEDMRMNGNDGGMEGEEFIEQIQSKFEELRQLNDQVIQNTKETIKLEIRANSETTQEQHKQILKELDGLMSNTVNVSKIIKQKIDQSKSMNIEYEKENPHSTLSTMMKNQLTSVTLRFQKSIQAFNDASESFRQTLREKISRQARLVNKDITEEQIDEIVESDNPAVFMQQALMIPDALLDRVAQIEQRHDGIVKIQQGVRELHELWSNLGVLIDEQQERLDQIENNVQQTLDYVQKGNKQLVKAREHQKRARKTTCCILVLVLVGAVIAAIVFGVIVP